MNDQQMQVANPYGEKTAPSYSGSVSVEQQRAIAEVQGSIIAARMNPRDPIKSMDLILNDCTRPSLADAAIYTYARGGTDISGPSIRLAETLALRWGNIDCGVKELTRHGGYSEMMAYATDLESLFTERKTFQVKHWRDLKNGKGYVLTDERDIYELSANLASRRLRACILAIIPGDVTEAAVKQCELTMKTSADTSPETVAKMVAAFAQFGVSKEQIEQRIQRRVDAIQPAQIVSLKKIYASLRDGMSAAADWFEAIEGEQPATTSSAIAAVLKKRGRPPKSPEAAASAPAAPAAPAASEPSPGPGYPETRTMIEAAKKANDPDALALAVSLIASLPKQFQAELRDLAAS